MLQTIVSPPMLDPWALPPEPVKRWTVEEYHNLIRLGVLAEDDPYELIEGWLVTKVTHNPPHDFVVSRLNRLLTMGLPDSRVLRSQLAITLADGEPEPDFAICDGPDTKYESRHPQPSEVAMVIEISDSSLARDRGVKLRSYARAGIGEYWIVNLLERRIEIYTVPEPKAANPRYAAQRIILPDEQVSLTLGDKVMLEFTARDILPTIA